jgi:DNA modification methylase
VNLATSIEELVPLPGNPRIGNVDAVAESLKKFGQRKPIVVRRSDKTIIAGNHTWQAAKKLGWSEIAVVWTDDDEDTAKAYALADNRTAEIGSYDEDALKAMVESVATASPELITAAGYDKNELARILNTPLDEIELVKDANEIPPAPRIAKSIIADVWLLGPHRLIVGDSTDPEILSKALDGKLADIIFTDPPYNVAYQGGTSEELTITNDAMSDTDFETFLTLAYGAMFENAKEGCPIYVCHADGSSVSFRSKFIDSGFMLKQILIWVKDNFTLSRQDYNWQHEPIIYGWKPGAAHPWFGPFNDSTTLDLTRDLSSLSKKELLELITVAKTVSTVVQEPRPRRNAEHPTMKPINLITRLLANSADRGALVLDPFGGSGSTLMAAHTLGMTAALVELDPIYADVICRRWQEATGVLPVNEITGKTRDFTVS